MNMRLFWVLGLALCLVACGSDDDEPTAGTAPPPAEEPPVLSISGTITAAPGFTFDSDLNDDASRISGVTTTNDTLTSAQRISNLGVVHGYASYRSTGVKADRFGLDFDEIDTYRVTLLAGQRVQLHVVDFDNTYLNPEGPGDLDLALFNSSGKSVVVSKGVGEFEHIEVPATAEYYVKVIAQKGISKYVLHLMSAIQSSPAVQPASFVSGDVIVKFKPESRLNAQQIRTEYAATLSHQDTSRATLIKLDTPTFSAATYGVASLDENELNALKQLRTLRAIKALSQRDDVEYAEPNYLYQASAEPNDPEFEQQWHYRQINLCCSINPANNPLAWDITTGEAAPPVIVAVIDTGVYLEHPDLADKLIAGYDFISDEDNSGDRDGVIDANPDDPGDSAVRGQSSSFHGTHVAGTIAAATNNGVGVAGVSWQARIMPLRVLGKEGGTTMDLIEALRFAARLANASDTLPPRKADIVNMSLGGAPYSYAFQQEIDAVRAEGVIIVAAAGNESTLMPAYPASYEGVISVSATSARNQLAHYSNFGPTVDIAAPGGDLREDIDDNGDTLPDGVFSTWVDDKSGERIPGYKYLEGTSMAAPHVAGVLALMKAVFPELTPDIVDAALAETRLTQDLGLTGSDSNLGFGLLDAKKAVDEAVRLAEGGVPLSLPPRIKFEPYWMNFSRDEDDSEPLEKILEIRNVGGTGGTPEAEVMLIDPSQPWLTLMEVENSVNAQGFGAYRVVVDSAGLALGRHSAEITVTFNVPVNPNPQIIKDTRKTQIIPVTLVVEETSEAQSRMAPQYVVLYDAATSLPVAEYKTPVGSVADTFKFYDVNPGSYYVLAGSDIDQDAAICQHGETCGARICQDGEACAANPNVFEVEVFDYKLEEGQANQVIANYDIQVNLRGKLDSEATATSTQGSKRPEPSRRPVDEGEESSVIRTER